MIFSWSRYVVWGRLVHALVVVTAVFFSVHSVSAQELTASESVNLVGLPTAIAGRVDEGPTIDGDVFGDPMWMMVTPATGFSQTTPDAGEPATERTEVRILYTAETIFFAVICYDDDPTSIIVADSRRDSSLQETDSFQIILDTYQDLQNGFVFGTNPAGIEYDGQVTNEGQGSGFAGQGRAQAGSGGGFNLNWDGSWQVATQISEIGWTAEFAIPFRTLRYPRGEVQTWGMNFQRNIRRRNETAFWAPLPRQYNLYRLSLAGQLGGLELPAQRNLQLSPYVLGEVVRMDAGSSNATSNGNVGGDLKYSITPSLTLDATINTDFAQVEVDDQQVNLDRFSLFFPEKRPFFLENAGLFSVGQAGFFRDVDIFFSRRIGIGPKGGAVPIRAGARLSGNISGLSVGLLNMQTSAISTTAANNFSVLRVRRDLQNRSNIGAMFVNRQGTGKAAKANDYNRSYAVDGRWGIGQRGLMSGFMAVTDTPGFSGNQHAFSIAGEYQSEALWGNVDYTEVGENFNPEVGFLRRKAYRRVNAFVMHNYRPESFLGLQELRPHAYHNTYWSVNGSRESQRTHIDNHWEWKNGYEIHTGMNVTYEGVMRPFEIFPGVIVPIGSYGHVELEYRSWTNLGAPVSVGFDVTKGGFFGGKRLRLAPSLYLRHGETLNVALTLDRNDIDLSGGNFVTNLARARIAYSFTPRILAESLIQYNDRADIWSMNLRFSWLQQANTGLFVVYNDTRGLGDFGLNTAGRSLVVKYTHLLNVLD